MRSLFCRLFLSFVFIAPLASFTTALVSYWAGIEKESDRMNELINQLIIHSRQKTVD